MRLHKPAAADAQPWLRLLRARCPTTWLAAFSFVGPGERAWTVWRNVALPFLLRDGIHEGWTLQGLPPLASTLPATSLATGDRSFLLCSDVNLASYWKENEGNFNYDLLLKTISITPSFMTSDILDVKVNSTMPFFFLAQH